MPKLATDTHIYGTGYNAMQPRDVMNYRDIMTIEAGKRGGRPCIRGMRMTVYDVLEYLASGMSSQEILADFPDLTAEDIRACLAYAADRERMQFTMNA